MKFSCTTLCVLLLLCVSIVDNFTHSCVYKPDGFYPVGNDCKKYVKCTHHKATFLTCKGEMVFDPVYRMCEDAEFVDCKAKQLHPTPPEKCVLTCPSTLVRAHVLNPKTCANELHCHKEGEFKCPKRLVNFGTTKRPMCRALYSTYCQSTGAHPHSNFCQRRKNGVYPNPVDCHSYIHCKSLVATLSKCPGGDIYDINKHRCLPNIGYTCKKCGGNVLPIPTGEEHLWGCCNGRFYHFEKSSCHVCEKEQKLVLRNEYTFMKCFNGHIYDDRFQFVKSCGSTNELHKRKEMSNLECCDRKIFRINKQTCRVCGKHAKLYSKKEATNFHCCKDDIFDKRTHQCRVCETTEKLYTIAESKHHQCCGYKFYDSREYRCKSCGKSDEIYAIAVADGIQCCKDKLYDVKEKVCKHCCGGTESYLFDNSEAEHNLCCGDAFYDKRKSECIHCGKDSRIFDKAEAVHMDCCNGKIFDTRKYECKRCAKEYATLKKSLAHNFYCCGDKFYDILVSECIMCSATSYTVVSNKDVEKFGCCKNQYFQTSQSTCIDCGGVEYLESKYNDKGVMNNWKCCGNKITATYC